MAEKPPEQYRVGKAYKFRVKGIPVTPERAEQLRQLKLAGARQERREAFIANLPRYFLRFVCLLVALAAGILIGRFLLP